jgi:AbrB family looped-hinge helix DNA binding protein
MAFLTAIVTIDRARNIVIPKPICDALHLEPGSRLEIEQLDGAIVLRPPQSARSRSVLGLNPGDREDHIEALIRRRPIREEETD